MKIFVIIMLLYGIFEIVSNSVHFSKGSKTKIGESAKKQHQELPLDIGPLHFFYKAIIMFIIGVLLVASSLTYLFYNTEIGLKFTLFNIIFHSGYGLIQLVVYHRTYKVWGSFVVYSIPLIVYLIII
jgi:hypothetical protein